MLRRPGGPDGLAVAEALATHLFGGPERVLAIDVGGITEPGAISGFLGTPQGFVGHGATLPIHALAERPHAVLLLRGIDGTHDAFRGLLARAVRDGYLADAQARRIGLSQSVVVLEAVGPGQGPEKVRRPVGFRPADGVARAPAAEPPTGRDDERVPVSSLAAAAVGDALAGECDVAAVPPPGETARRDWVLGTLGRLAASYRAAGVELAWAPEVETYLAVGLDAASPRERERVVETRVGRAVRPCLRSGRRPVRARVRRTAEGLVADVEA